VAPRQQLVARGLSSFGGPLGPGSLPPWLDPRKARLRRADPAVGRAAARGRARARASEARQPAPRGDRPGPRARRLVAPRVASRRQPRGARPDRAGERRGRARGGRHPREPSEARAPRGPGPTGPAPHRARPRRVDASTRTSGRWSTGPNGAGWPGAARRR
jgi:hypothetical protein